MPKPLAQRCATTSLMAPAVGVWGTSAPALPPPEVEGGGAPPRDDARLTVKAEDSRLTTTLSFADAKSVAAGACKDTPAIMAGLGTGDAVAGSASMRRGGLCTLLVNGPAPELLVLGAGCCWLSAGGGADTTRGVGAGGSATEVEASEVVRSSMPSSAMGATPFRGSASLTGASSRGPPLEDGIGSEGSGVARLGILFSDSPSFGGGGPLLLGGGASGADDAAPKFRPFITGGAGAELLGSPLPGPPSPRPKAGLGGPLGVGASSLRNSGTSSRSLWSLASESEAIRSRVWSVSLLSPDVT